jgi:alanyl aminopeptidase
MRLFACLLLLCAVLPLAACDSGPQATPERQKRQQPARAAIASTATDIPTGQLPEHVEPVHYKLDLSINPDQRRYEGTVEIEIDLKAPKREFFLHGKDLQVSKVTASLPDRTHVNGSYLQVDQSGVARLSFDQQLPVGRASILIPFSAAFETAPDALTAMTDNGIRYVWSQFEEISARRAFPCFDEPRFKTPFDISVTTIDREAVISNTLPVSQEKIADGVVRTTFATTAPLPTYLVAIMVGPYDVLEGRPAPPSRLRPQPLPLRAVTVNGKGERARFALAATPSLLDTLETYFAAPFPYPKLDIITPPNFLAGGMENAGAITYTERAILLSPSASVSQRRYFELIHAHEIAHQWFGDLVTPAWWNDIWLNESFASWAGNKSAAQTWPADELDRETTRDALDVMDRDALASARSIRQPIKSNGDIFNAFDGLTYNKGAAVLQMFETWLGPDTFREGVRLHMRKYAHGNATTDDFMASLAEASRKPEIVGAMNTFLDQPGVPLVHVETSCSGKDLDVKLTQTPYGASPATDKRRWTVPVCMREMGQARPLPCTLLADKPVTFTVRKMCGTPLMPNLNGSGYYRFTTATQDWAALVGAMRKMNPAEQLSTLHALRSAFRAGDADAATFVAGLRTAASSGTWDVVDLATSFLTDAMGNLVPAARQQEAQQAVAKWLERPMAKTGPVARPGERASVTLLRAAQARWSVRLTEDPQVLGMLAPAGMNALKTLSGPQPESFVQDDLTPLSIWAALRNGGMDATTLALNAIASSRDAEIRNAIIRSLAAARDEKAQAVIRDFALSGALRAREILFWLREEFTDPSTRAGTWTWFRKSYPALVERIGKAAETRLYDLPSQLCEATSGEEVEAFFKPMLKTVEGAPRKVANALETIRNCVSWRASRGQAFSDALLAPPPAPPKPKTPAQPRP